MSTYYNIFGTVHRLLGIAIFSILILLPACKNSRSQYPIIQSFTAEPLEINQGESAALTPIFSNGSGSIDPDIGSVTTGKAISVAPDFDTTYTLTVTNVVGARVTQQVTVTVNHPENGILDETFNNVGYVTHNGASGSDSDDVGNAVVINSSGRIIVAGFSRSDTEGLNMALWRYYPDGSLDTSFNGVGYLTHHNAAGGNYYDYATGVAIDNNDRIVVAGASDSTPAITDMAIWRYNSDGSLDTSFNGVGYVTHNNAAGGNSHDYASGIAIDKDGNIVVAGSSWASDSNRGDIVVWRYTEDGILDNTFNGKGFVTFETSTGGDLVDTATDLIIDSQDRIVVSGFSTSSTTNKDMTLWRFNSDGSLDTTFATVGYVTHDGAAGPNGRDQGMDLVLDQLDRIVVAGSSLNNFALWRFNSNGSLDTTFNEVGYVTHQNAGGVVGDSGAMALSLDSSGRIVATGFADAAQPRDMALWRYNSDGTLDTTFSGRGYTTHNNAAGGNWDDYGRAMTIDTNGRIVVAGQSYNHTLSGNILADMAVWRYIP
jgi:uncharacterized delta-60 repeat protein